jgi:hypothetical protein
MAKFYADKSSSSPQGISPQIIHREQFTTKISPHTIHRKYKTKSTDFLPQTSFPQTINGKQFTSKIKSKIWDHFNVGAILGGSSSRQEQFDHKQFTA